MAEVDADLDLGALLREVRRIEVQSRRPVAGVLAGGYRSVFQGAGLDFDAVREYVPGDPRRAVDWNVTARTGRPHVRKYVDERERSLVFLLDLSASMDVGGAAWTPRQVAARFCALLALAAVQNDDRVGLVCFRDEVVHHLPARKGRRHALALVRDCLAQPAGGRTDLRPPLEFAARVLDRNATVFLVSDFHHDGWERALNLCARRHDLVAVRLQDPARARAGVGLERVFDPESGGRMLLDWSSPVVRAEHEQHLRQRDERTLTALGRAGVDRLDLPLPAQADIQEVVGPVVRFFRMREARGAKR